MHPRLPSIDLNLLLVLEALLEERSATRAATRLGLSQPGVSAALARLRAAVGDPLLVRGPRGMEPTPRALELEPHLREALGALGRAIFEGQAFDAATSERRFTVAATDYVQFVLLGKLVERLQRRAPRVSVRVIPVTAHFPWTELEAGTLDLVLGRVPHEPEGLRRKLLFRDRLVLIVRRGHAMAKKAWTLEDYCAVSHVEAVLLEGPTLVDQLLAGLQRRRRVAVTVPGFLSAPFVVLDTDCAFALAERIAVALARTLPLTVLEAPFAAPELAVHAFWHERMHADPGHALLRRALSEAAAQLD